MKLSPWAALLLSASLPASAADPSEILIPPQQAALSAHPILSSQAESAAQARRIAQLAAQIRHYRKRYYQGEQTISDQQFDGLVLELQQLLAPLSTHPVLSEVGTTPDDEPGSGSRPLAAPMLSLQSAWSDSSVQAFIGRIRVQHPDAQLLLQPKLDGLALELVYEQGYLKQALTRGDGQRGEDVTAAVIASGAVPLALESAEPEPQWPDRLVVRGELYADHQQYRQQFSADYSSARQLAVATVLTEQPAASQLRALRFMPWLWLDSPHDSTLAGLRQLERWGFSGMTAQSELFTLASDTAPDAAAESAPWLAYYRHWRGRGLQGAELDGIVISLDSQRLRRQWGETRRDPRWSLAWKFDTPQLVTRVEAIVWQQGRTGRLTPVLQISPVTLLGRTITRVSAFSANWLQAHQAGIGSEVTVTLKGSAVPQLVEVLSRSSEIPAPPAVVPGLCLTDITGCEQRLLLQLDHSRQVLGIDGVTPSLLRELISQGELRSLSALVRRYPPEFRPDIRQQLLLLGLPGLGAEATALLARQLTTLHQLSGLTEAQWYQLSGRRHQAAWQALQQPTLQAELKQLAALFDHLPAHQPQYQPGQAGY